ncbi:hypothetical protein HYFRA_00013365 [Hymenoscyphus fraxineus]|uniref:Uncharacterized protein n=1 Tax=Hymenoscyphus fraxineus TaxID=746836 RepID=A0A9N9Q152_9HELO|nr:hypothetical protein HYFRA_00013365 [Hymenoscyphus fraxineus]
MNTVKSFWLGWGSLCVAGGGAYYFAKKSINEDRIQRFEAERRKKQIQDDFEYSSKLASQARGSATLKGDGGPPRADSTGSPSQEASSDPAPTSHPPENEKQRILEKSKYEASEPFRARKGDRFS